MKTKSIVVSIATDRCRKDVKGERTTTKGGKDVVLIDAVAPHIPCSTEEEAKAELALAATELSWMSLAEHCNSSLDLDARGRVTASVSVKGGKEAQRLATEAWILQQWCEANPEVFTDFIEVCQTASPDKRAEFLDSIFRQHQEQIDVVYGRA